MYHLPAIRDFVRNDFNQASSSGFVSDSNIDQWANEGYYKYALMLMKAYQGYFETTATLDITAAAEAIALPYNFSNQPSFLNMVIVEKVLASSRVPLQYRKRYDGANATDGSAQGESYLPTYDFRGNSLILEPTPTTSETGGIRIVYKALPPKLRSATAQAGAATTITLDASADPRDDYYTGASIYIYSGTGAGQVRAITDYVGLTKVATVATWTVTPDSTSVFAILIHQDFPEIFHELIPMYATKKAFLKERSLGAKRDYDGSVLKELESQFMKFIDERTQSRKFVQGWNIELA